MTTSSSDVARSNFAGGLVVGGAGVALLVGAWWWFHREPTAPTGPRPPIIIKAGLRQRGYVLEFTSSCKELDLVEQNGKYVLAGANPEYGLLAGLSTKVNTKRFDKTEKVLLTLDGSRTVTVLVTGTAIIIELSPGELKREGRRWLYRDGQKAFKVTGINVTDSGKPAYEANDDGGHDFEFHLEGECPT